MRHAWSITSQYLPDLEEPHSCKRCGLTRRMDRRPGRYGGREVWVPQFLLGGIWADQRAWGGVPECMAPPDARPTIDLMAALKASLAKQEEG